MNIEAKEHCCQEASMASHQFYIPCNRPAVHVVGWKGRSDSPIRMCDMCSDHNVKNRGGYVVETYTGPTGAGQAWPEANTATSWPVATPSSPWDAMSEDQLLMLHMEKKKAIATATAEEMELRKYIVGRAFPAKQEGMNNKELGNGYVLKAGIKYNYNLAENEVVENCLARIASIGNMGPFIADRLVSWKPSFLLTEYRELQENAKKGEKFAENVLNIVNEMLTITEAAPTLEVKEPKAKKG